MSFVDQDCKAPVGVELGDILQNELELMYNGDDDLCTDQWENSYYPYFYSNVYTDAGSFEKTPVYRLYASDVKKLFNDRIKHKKLNDANKIFIDE